MLSAYFYLPADFFFLRLDRRPNEEYEDRAMLIFFDPGITIST